MQKVQNLQLKESEERLSRYWYQLVVEKKLHTYCAIGDAQICQLRQHSCNVSPVIGSEDSKHVSSSHICVHCTHIYVTVLADKLTFWQFFASQETFCYFSPSRAVRTKKNYFGHILTESNRISQKFWKDFRRKMQAVSLIDLTEKIVSRGVWRGSDPCRRAGILKVSSSCIIFFTCVFFIKRTRLVPWFIPEILLIFFIPCILRTRTVSFSIFSKRKQFLLRIKKASY
jgi:hypothetical protein